MLEQVSGLRVDLERIFLIQQVRIEPFATHLMIVLHTTTLRLESPGDPGHSAITTAAADPLARVQAVHPDERLSRLAGLLGHLEQAYLDRDVSVAGVQIPDLIPYSSVNSVSVKSVRPCATVSP
jgi:hypothetical protein